MGFIYKITNNINQKSYIGKTERTISIRYKEHLRHKDYLDQPLYRAFRKYGIENFSINQIEECDNAILDEREIYWINYYQTYKDGYNATAGGEGSIKTFEEDIDIIIQRYLAGERLDLLCKEFHHDYTSIRPHLIKKGLKIDSNAGPKKLSKPIIQINPQTNEIIKIYDSISAAARAICEPGKNYKAIANHISKQKNTNNICHKFLWKTINKGDDDSD